MGDTEPGQFGPKRLDWKGLCLEHTKYIKN